MQIISRMSVLAFASLTAATCYKSGNDFRDRDEALDLAGALCFGGDFTPGRYPPSGTAGSIRSACRDTLDGNKIDFIITHISGGGELELPPEECLDGLRKEILGCSKGGDSRYTNWEYRVDPNAGGCL